MDDRRVGLVIRALRRRRGWRQQDLASAAGVSQAAVSRAERGHLESGSLRTLRRVLVALDARAEVAVRWRAGELDRVVDARHALLVATAARVLSGAGWYVLQEVTYSVYGERGAIDLVGVRRADRTAVALEIKTELSSWEEAQRRFDVKVRLLPSILFERLGWRPTTIGRVIVFQESMTNRRRIAAIGPGALHAYPARGRGVRQWLADPHGPLGGLWFLSPSPTWNGRESRGGFHRVRGPRRSSPPAATSVATRTYAPPAPPDAVGGSTTSPSAAR